MNQALKLFPQVFQAWHRLSLNAPIVLSVERADMHIATAKASGTAKLQFQWTPQSQLNFKYTGQQPDPLLFSSAFGELSMPGLTFPFAITRRTYQDRISTLRGVFVGERILRTSLPFLRHVLPAEAASKIPCNAAIFYIPNWVDYVCGPLASGDAVWAGRLLAKIGSFDLEIHSLPDSSKNISALKRIGGHAVTHIGKISTFFPSTVDTIHDTLGKLHPILSFLRGSWSGPLLPRYSVASIDFLEELSPIKLNPWKATHKPIDPHDGIGLINAIEKLYLKLCDPAWAQPYDLAITWYVESATQAGGIEASIVLTQVAFELLAWVTFVEVEKTVSATAFNKANKYPAAAKLRMLLTRAKIPVALPAHLVELQALATKEGWADGPQTLTSMRNALAHAEQRNTVLLSSPEARIEAWKLGLHYLEQLILHVALYSGKYANRISGVTETVPW